MGGGGGGSWKIPAFHSGFFFVKCLLLCSVWPALANNIKSTITVEVG